MNRLQQTALPVVSSLTLALTLISSMTATPTATAQDLVYAVELYWPKVTLQMQAEQAARLAQLMRNDPQAIGLSPYDTAPPEVSTDVFGYEGSAELAGRWLQPFDELPDIHVKFLPEYNEVRLFDESMLKNLQVDRNIGEKAALEQAKSYLAALSRLGVLNAKEYSLKHAKIGYGRAGSGSQQSKELDQHVFQYRITIPKSAHGIALANAGVRFAIQADGRLAGMRLGGVEINRKAKDAVKPLSIALQPSQLKLRFEQQLPDDATAKLYYDKTLYVMPEGQQRAMVEPQQFFSYSLVYHLEGEEVLSRRQEMALSLTDPNANPTYFSATTAATDSGDAR